MSASTKTELQVLSGGAVLGGLASAAKAFRKQTGHSVVFTFATAPVLRARVEDADGRFDVIVAPLPLMQDFERNGRIVSGSAAVIGSVKAGVVVRKDAPGPDVSSAAAFKQAILASRSLVYNEGSSGIFVERLLARLGIAGKVKARTVRLPDAEAVMNHLASSSLPGEIGFGQITAIRAYSDRGVKLVGPLPKEIENATTYAAGIAAGAGAPAPAAADFIRFLITPAAQAAFKATGVE